MSSDTKSIIESHKTNESADVLRQTMINCFEDASKNPDFTFSMLKDYMEPAFIQEGYRDEFAEVKSVLVVRLDEIGDNVLTSGFLRELRKNYPKAYITLVVKPAVHQLVELCPYVNEILEFYVSDITDIADINKRFEKILQLCYTKLWKKRYDIAFLPRWDKDLAYFAVFLAYFSGARERIGYSASLNPSRKDAEDFLDKFLTFPVVSPPDVVHEAARNFYMLKARNLTVEDDSLELWYGADDYCRMKKIAFDFSRGKKIIAVVPCANVMKKIYPTDRLIMALSKIKRPYNCFVLLGGSEVKEFGDYIIDELPSGWAINLMGETNLRETAAMLSLSSMYIGMDTGVMHMAAALKLPVLEINCAPLTLPHTPFLFTDRFAPWQTKSITVRPQKALPPCDASQPSNGCEVLHEMHCISQIHPNDIVAAYEKLSSTI